MKYKNFEVNSLDHEKFEMDEIQNECYVMSSRGFKKLEITKLKGVTLEIYAERFVIEGQFLFPIFGIFCLVLVCIFAEFCYKVRCFRQ
jgi:hypothetical protein